ncbi:MAG TPA: HNH endonuclease [Acidimicrobiia bacterium]|nr:HNH endonuclease [Acidimicrobiia bacterium]
MIMGPSSEPLDVGRKTRVIPPALRRAVMVRDRHCQHPGCDRPARWCDVDHIIPWWQGGETKLSNLQLLCRFHHSLKHKPEGPPHIPKRSERAQSTYQPLEKRPFSESGRGRPGSRPQARAPS